MGLTLINKQKVGNDIRKGINSGGTCFIYT